MKRLTISLSAILSAMCSLVVADETKHFPNRHQTSWLHIDYPADFEMDPKSMQGEAKWWARFTAPGASLTIETMSHGYCSDRLFHQEGFRTPEEYILKNIIPGSPLRTAHAGYDRLLRVDLNSVTVVFLKSDADWGKCYQKLSFAFADGSYEKHRRIIMRVIESALPAFAKTNSEPDNADHPSTAPDSKSEASSKPKPESEARPQ